MEVSFVIEKDDLRRVWQWARMPLAITCTGLVLTFIVQATLVGILSHDYPLGVALSLVMTPIYLAGALLRSRRLGREATDKALARDPRLTGPRTVRLEQEGISLQLPTETRLYSWDDVAGFYQHSRYLLVSIRAVGIVAIPLSAFGGRPEAEAFWTAMLAYKMSSGDSPAAFEAAEEADETVWPPPPRRA